MEDVRLTTLEHDMGQVRIDLAAVRGFIDGAWKEFSKDCYRRFDQIITYQEAANGRLLEHDKWIAAREPVCKVEMDDVRRIRRMVEEHDAFINASKGPTESMAESVRSHEDFINKQLGGFKVGGMLGQVVERLFFMILGAATLYLTVRAHLR